MSKESPSVFNLLSGLNRDKTTRSLVFQFVTNEMHQTWNKVLLLDIVKM